MPQVYPPSSPLQNEKFAAAALAADELARAELRLLAAIAPLGRWGLSLARRAGVTADDIAADDLSIIWGALEQAHAAEGVGPDVRNEAALRAAAHLLRAAGLWDSGDGRHAGAGMVWGPRRLVRLFVGDGSLLGAEAEIPQLAAALLALEGRVAA